MFWELQIDFPPLQQQEILDDNNNNNNYILEFPRGRVTHAQPLVVIKPIAIMLNPQSIM